MFADIGGNFIDNRWIVVSGNILEIRKLVMASFTWPITYSITFLRQKHYRSKTCFGMVLLKLQHCNTTISDRSNYILPDISDVTNRIEMVMNLLFCQENYNTILNFQN